MDLTVTTGVEGEHVVVQVEGEIDIHTGPALREALAELVAAGHHHLVVDLDAVGFMDSTGLGVLINTLARLRPHDGSLRVVTTRGAVLQIFRITGLTRVFPIHPSIGEAIAAGGPPAQVGVDRAIGEAGTAVVLR